MASQEQEIRYPDYPLFKGLQKPLEFMGIQGRYIYWAAGAIGGAIVGFILAYCLIGFIAGLIALVASISIGAADCTPRKTTKVFLFMPILNGFSAALNRAIKQA